MLYNYSHAWYKENTISYFIFLMKKFYRIKFSLFSLSMENEKWFVSYENHLNVAHVNPTWQPTRQSCPSRQWPADPWLLDLSRFYGQLLRAESFSGDPRCVWSGPVERVPAGITHRGHSTSNYCPLQPTAWSSRRTNRWINRTRSRVHISSITWRRNSRQVPVFFSRETPVSRSSREPFHVRRATTKICPGWPPFCTRRYHTSRSAWQYGVSRAIALDELVHPRCIAAQLFCGRTITVTAVTTVWPARKFHSPSSPSPPSPRHGVFFANWQSTKWRKQYFNLYFACRGKEG